MAIFYTRNLNVFISKLCLRHYNSFSGIICRLIKRTFASGYHSSDNTKLPLYRMLWCRFTTTMNLVRWSSLSARHRFHCSVLSMFISMPFRMLSQTTLSSIIVTWCWWPWSGSVLSRSEESLTDVQLGSPAPSALLLLLWWKLWSL